MKHELAKYYEDVDCEDWVEGYCQDVADVVPGFDVGDEVGEEEKEVAVD